MGFLDAITKVILYLEDEGDRKLQEMHNQVSRESRRMQNHSVTDLKVKAVQGSPAERVAAARMLESKGIVPQKSQKTGSSKSTSPAKTSPAYRKGDSKDVKTTIVLSAPGQAEEKAGRPAAGQTGATLQEAIKELHRKDPSTFPSSRLDDYTIVNAVEDVHYMKKTGRTEGNDSEICGSGNVKRMQNALKGSENVVALGDKAQLIVEKSEFKGTVLRGEHPSMQALNRKYDSDAETPSDRHKDRVRQWVDEIEK